MKFTRKEIWEHNSFSGCVQMAFRNMLRIQRSSTVTGESRKLAYEVELALEKLALSLKTRRDQA